MLPRPVLIALAVAGAILFWFAFRTSHPSGSRTVQSPPESSVDPTTLSSVFSAANSKELKRKSKTTRKRTKQKKKPRQADEAEEDQSEELVVTEKPNEFNLLASFDLDNFLRTFKAANPAYQDYCVNVMKTTERQSQFSQDMVLFYNFFWRYAVEGKRGFYVDSGANEWKHISNTFFYDVCLGWDGLCIEPDVQYIDNLKKHRSCTTLNMCISADKSSLHFNPDGASGSVTETGGRVVQCDSLQHLLAEKGRDSVDLWSLDVEGHELNVLGSVNFEAVTVKVLLVEDFWINGCSLDKLLLGGPSGLTQWMKLPIDSVYIHPSVTPPLKRWMWPKSGDDWNTNNRYRESKKAGTCN